MIDAVVSYLYRRAKLTKPIWLGLGVHDIDHSPTEFPEVTIIIPTRDRIDLLRPCLESIQTLTNYPTYRILVLDNDSKAPESFEFFSAIESESLTVIPAPGEFNYSEIMNRGVDASTSELVCLLNNDTVIQSANWLTEMVAHLAEPKVGLVGALLLYPNGSIQHAGIALGFKGLAGHIYAGHQPSNSTPAFEHCYAVSAATFACALTSRKLWHQLNGLDTNFKVGLNDVDFGMRASYLGYDSVVCTHARLIHLESESRKSMKTFKGFARAVSEILWFSHKHPKGKLVDPYFKFDTE